MSTSIIVSVITIGMTTFAMSYVGVFMGSRGGEYLESKAEFVGGIVLIGIGVKILIEHTLFQTI
jgi:putative Mn2+ efflux pump MntP